MVTVPVVGSITTSVMMRIDRHPDHNAQPCKGGKKVSFWGLFYIKTKKKNV